MLTADRTFWTNDPGGAPESASDVPDGEAVENDAVTQGLRTAYATGQDKRRAFSESAARPDRYASSASSSRWTLVTTCV